MAAYGVVRPYPSTEEVSQVGQREEDGRLTELFKSPSIDCALDLLNFAVCGKADNMMKLSRPSSGPGVTADDDESTCNLNMAVDHAYESISTLNMTAGHAYESICTLNTTVGHAYESICTLNMTAGHTYESICILNMTVGHA